MRKNNLKPKIRVSSDMLKFLDRSGLIPEQRKSRKTFYAALATAAISVAMYGALLCKNEDAFVTQDNSTSSSYLVEQDNSTRKSYSIDQVCQDKNSTNSGLEKRLASDSLAERLKALNEQYPISEEQIQSYIKTAMQMVPNLSPEITPEFVRYIIKIESTNNPNAVSSSDARGLGQQKKAAWYDATRKRQDVGDSDEGLPHDCAFDPYTSIETTVAYLDWVAKHAERGNPKWESYCKIQRQNQTSAAYNGGPSALKNAGYNINKMRQETRNYIKKLDRLRESERA